VICLLPLVQVTAQSLSNTLATRLKLVSLWPVGFTLDNYRYLLGDQKFASALGISIQRVIFGVALNLLVAVLTAYPLSLDHIHMPGRQIFKMIPWASPLNGRDVPFSSCCDGVSAYGQGVAPQDA